MSILKTEQDEKEFKLWLKALRSGNFKQTTGCLQDDSGYCCLGVACEVLIDEYDKVRNVLGMLHDTNPSDQIHSPDWLCIVDSYISGHTGTSLIQYNDDHELTFDEIVDILEENVLGTKS